MIPNNNPNIRAKFYEREMDDDDKPLNGFREYTLPVVAWDHEGSAMVPSYLGRLATAHGHADDLNEFLASKTRFGGITDDEQATS